MILYPSMTDRLITQYETIGNIIAAIDSSRLLLRPQPAKWNIHDNIAHLGRYQPVFIDRVNQILLKDVPTFPRYKAEDDPEFENWRALDTATIINHIAADRIKINNLLLRLTDTELSRTGIHTKYGTLTLIQWTEFFLLHEAHHVFTIFQLANDVDLK